MRSLWSVYEKRYVIIVLANRMIKTFLKNLKFLWSIPLRDYMRDLEYTCLLRTEDMIEFGELKSSTKIPHILDYSETLDLLVKEPKSFCRIGDGEINIIKGRDIPFQKYDSRLADYLKRIVSYDVKDCYVGINYNYFHSTKCLNDCNRKFYLLDIFEYRKYLVDNCVLDKTYIAAAFNQVYMFFDTFDYETHYKKVIEMIRDKDIVMFCGENVFSDIKYNIFDNASSIEYVTCKSRNSFEQFDEIMSRCLNISNEKVLAFILGPTSKALVWELSRRGYISWDIGHLAKDYDYYMKGISKNPESVRCFFSPE